MIGAWSLGGKGFGIAAPCRLTSPDRWRSRWPAPQGPPLHYPAGDVRRLRCGSARVLRILLVQPNDERALPGSDAHIAAVTTVGAVCLNGHARICAGGTTLFSFSARTGSFYPIGKAIRRGDFLVAPPNRPCLTCPKFVREYGDWKSPLLANRESEARPKRARPVLTSFPRWLGHTLHRTAPLSPVPNLLSQPEPRGPD